MAVTIWLIDKSVLARIHHAENSAEWISRINRGLVRMSNVTRLEVGYSARSASELRDAFDTPPLSAMPIEYLTPSIEDRAIEVQLQLASRGHHRAPSIADLLIAATAELKNLTVLHVDKDFDLIAEFTGQSVERLKFLDR